MIQSYMQEKIDPREFSYAETSAINIEIITNDLYPCVRNSMPNSIGSQHVG